MNRKERRKGEKRKNGSDTCTGGGREEREEGNERMAAMALFDLGERRREYLGRIWAEQNRKEIRERNLSYFKVGYPKFGPDLGEDCNRAVFISCSPQTICSAIFIL